MRDFSQLLMERTSTILTQWVQAVAESRRIASADGLSRLAIRDHIDQVLEALVSVLALNQDNNVSQVIAASLSHGKLRASQGFAPGEIAQEYHLLRLTIREALQPELSQGTATEAVRALAMIDEVMDAAMAYCFQSYHSERIDGLTQIQQQLNLTIKELTRLVKTSQDNLSMLAHELKSPLAAIMGYADLFLRQQRMQRRDQVLSYEAIERIIRAGQQLLHLINDTLELSRTSQDTIELNPTTLSVSEVLNGVVEIMTPLAIDRGLQLKLILDQGPDKVDTDLPKLQQILINLVSNAIQYTQAGTVTLTTWRLPPYQWAIAVSDTGDGIEPADQSKIFHPFVRVQTLTDLPSPQVPGAFRSSGVGLAIVERLVALLKGRIYLASQVGEGSTFTIILPMAYGPQGTEPDPSALRGDRRGEQLGDSPGDSPGDNLGDGLGDRRGDREIQS